MVVCNDNIMFRVSLFGCFGAISAFLQFMFCPFSFWQPCYTSDWNRTRHECRGVPESYSRCWWIKAEQFSFSLDLLLPDLARI
jgi:hypothetical protein